MRLLFLLPCLLVPSIACGGGNAASQGSAPVSPSLGPNPEATSAVNDPSVPKPPSHPDSDKVTWKQVAPAKQCHPTKPAAGELVAALTAMASNCVDTSKMHLLGSPSRGEGREGNQQTDPMVTRIPLKALANHCYRVFGLAEPTVKDFDIAVMDSSGKSAGEDLTDSNDAIVLEDGAICFKQDDNVSVNAAVAKGSGKWAVEIWSD